ncbi:hypothetical protein DQ353_16290 [Arthrobacter sp. AQ5-05]|uniref:hypothetical protein n=1 Tax=Arthrobacter sp. AQ5-05 TaxID=2184581 RepID=UPI000DCC391F|nr:hypothetical protein [Arthrobacter sp. AQ5-05]RAX48244.1 hypothetical protein DQ353_16290 [Arthrobacter sp. AQ5-05]
MQEPAATDTEPSTTGAHAGFRNQAPKYNNLWLAGGVGLVAGLAIGLGIGFSASTAPAADSPSAAITNAVQACELVDVLGVTVMDEGNSVTLETAGNDTKGAPYSDVVCVLDALEMPESVKSRMASTRSLDGMQDAAWSGYGASWNYHPDNGLNIVVESQEQP